MLRVPPAAVSVLMVQGPGAFGVKVKGALGGLSPSRFKVYTVNLYETLLRIVPVANVNTICTRTPCGEIDGGGWSSDWIV